MKWKCFPFLASRPILFVYVFCVLLGSDVNGYFSSSSNSNSAKSQSQFVYTSSDPQQNCFCELKGSINDCGCNVDTVDHFNNVKIYPRLQSLLVKNFFRYFQVNLKKECPFWKDDSKCAMRYCHVESCEENSIPDGIRAASGDFQEESSSYKVRCSCVSIHLILLLHSPICYHCLLVWNEVCLMLFRL